MCETQLGSTVFVFGFDADATGLLIKTEFDLDTSFGISTGSDS